MFLQPARKRAVCKDGFSISIQASEHHYCTPRIDGAYTEYDDVELGFPSEAEPLITEYVEVGYDDIPDPPTESVYPHVPTNVVKKMIDKHGGIIEGEMPKLNLAKVVQEELI